MARNYTDEELDWLRKNRAGRVMSELTEAFNARFSRRVSQCALKGTCTRHGIESGRSGRFQKGRASWNKGLKGLDIGGRNTRFQKGHQPKNQQPVGALRIRHRDDYIDIKTAQPNAWTPYHWLIYQRAYGPIPQGHVVIFRDGNNRNLHYQNLAAVSRSELVRINQKMALQNLPKALKPSVVALAQVEEKIRGMGNA